MSHARQYVHMDLYDDTGVGYDATRCADPCATRRLVYQFAVNGQFKEVIAGYDDDNGDQLFVVAEKKPS